MLQIIALLIVHNTTMVCLSARNIAGWDRAGTFFMNLVVFLIIITQWPTV